MRTYKMHESNHEVEWGFGGMNAALMIIINIVHMIITCCCLKGTLGYGRLMVVVPSVPQSTGSDEMVEFRLRVRPYVK